MEELSLISRQEPGIATIDNFQELKQALEQQLEVYKALAYSQDSVKAAKKDKATLNKLKKAIDDKRKEIKKVYMQPYTVVEAQAKELIALIDEPLALIAGFIAREEAEEKEVRRKDIAAYFYQNSAALGDLAEAIFTSPAFYDPKWENKSTTAKTYQGAIIEKINAAAVDISTIRATGGKHTAALLERYIGTLSTSSLAEYKTSLEAAESAAETTFAPVLTDDNVIGYKVLKLTGTAQQLAQILEQMELWALKWTSWKTVCPMT